MQLQVMLLSLTLFSLFAGEFEAPEWDEQKELAIYKNKKSSIGDHAAHYPLHLAAANGRLDIVKHRIETLLDDINHWDNLWNRTPLMVAVEYEQKDIVTYLLGKGASINEDMVGYGWTALACACEKEDAEMVKILIKNGASLQVHGCAMLNVALNNWHGSISIVKELMNHRAPYGGKIRIIEGCFNEADRKIPALTRLALLYGLEVEDLYRFQGNHFNNDSIFPALHFDACFNKSNHLLEAENMGLLEKNVNDRDTDGNTPLFYAATQNSTKMINWLLTKSAAIFVKNNDGHNVFWYLDRILHRTDLSEERRENYKKNMTLLCKYAWHRQEACKNLNLPQDMQKYIKSLC